MDTVHVQAPRLLPLCPTIYTHSCNSVNTSKWPTQMSPTCSSSSLPSSSLQVGLLESCHCLPVMQRKLTSFRRRRSDCSVHGRLWRPILHQHPPHHPWLLPWPHTCGVYLIVCCSRGSLTSQTDPVLSPLSLAPALHFRNIQIWLVYRQARVRDSRGPRVS